MGMLGYPSNKDPRHARAYMHNVYERYVQGIDVFPRARLAVSPAELPRKSRQIASTLFEAWRVIDLDRKFFGDSALELIERLKAKDGKEARSGIVINKVGKNAVQWGKVTVTDGQSQLIHGVVAGEERDELFANLPIRLSDGRTINITDGHVMEPPAPDGLTFRGRPDGVSSFFGVDGVDPNPQTSGFHLISPQ